MTSANSDLVAGWQVEVGGKLNPSLCQGGPVRPGINQVSAKPAAGVR